MLSFREGLIQTYIQSCNFSFFSKFLKNDEKAGVYIELLLVFVLRTQDHLLKLTQRDVMGREVGGGFMFGNACKN